MKEKSSQTSCFYFLPSRKVRVRDINASPISRITNFRDDEGRQSGMMEGTASLNNSHSRVFLSGISTVCEQRKWRRSSTTTFEDDPRRSLAGKVRGGLYPSPVAAEGRMGGFTLIELLIAVVIIGVLVAVAVPQYQKAVLKSRFGSLMPLGKALQGGNEAYYLEHGQYTNDPTNLDVRANNSNAQITLGNEDQHKYVLLTRDDINNNLRIYQQRSPNFAGETHCEALIDNAQANWLCRDALKGTLVGNKFGYTVYSLSEETVGSLARTYWGTEGISLSDGDKCVASTVSKKKCSSSQFENGAICDGRDAGYGCYNSQFTDHAMCYGGALGCGGTSTFTNQAVCVGQGTGACGVQFSDHASCVGDAAYNSFQGSSCHNANFSDHSSCFGVRSDTIVRNAENCNKNNFSDNSYCVGSATNTCRTGDFKTGSICYANASGACAGSTYDATSCCAGGANCENVADRCETKNITVPPQPTVPDY